MKKFILAAAFAAFTSIGFSQAPTTLVDAIKANKEISTFSSALQTTGVDTIINSSGPYTVFAPDNLAIGRAPGNVSADGMKYHVVRGEFDTSKLKSRIGDSVNGKYTFTTLSGAKLWASIDGDKIKLTDEKGMSAWVRTADIKAGNGVIHIIDNILTPSYPSSAMDIGN